MRFTQFFQYIYDTGIRNIVVHVAGAVPGDLFRVILGQSEVQLFREDKVKLSKLPDLLFHRCHQVVFYQKA